MNAQQALTFFQIIGAGCVATAIGAGILCYHMWKTLPDSQRVWAIVVLLAVCSVLTFWPALFFLIYGDRSAIVAPYSNGNHRRFIHHWLYPAMCPDSAHLRTQGKQKEIIAPRERSSISLKKSWAKRKGVGSAV